MKPLFCFWLRVMPFTVGIASSLIALCYLVKFYDYGLDFDREYIWLFVVFFLTGFPTLVYGMNRISEEFT
jgi:hypothetical protein